MKLHKSITKPSVLIVLMSNIIFTSYSYANQANSLDITDLLMTKKVKSAKKKSSSAKNPVASQKEKALNMKNLKTVTTYEYEKNKTYKLKLSTFISTVISLPEDEKILTYKLGDSEMFNVYHDKALPNILTVNVLENGYYSNLLVITDKQKIYNFFLKSYPDSRWVTPHFTYYITKSKEEKKAQLLATLKTNNKDISHVKKLDNLNTSYKIKGDDDISPLYVYDDGKFTYIDFGDKYISDRFPTVYKVIDEYDSIVNNHTKGNLIVVETLSPEGFILKNGDKHVCITPKKDLREVYKNVK